MEALDVDLQKDVIDLLVARRYARQYSHVQFSCEAIIAHEESASRSKGLMWDVERHYRFFERYLVAVAAVPRRLQETLRDRPTRRN